jgi:hypothetical protein
LAVKEFVDTDDALRGTGAVGAGASTIDLVAFCTAPSIRVIPPVVELVDHVIVTV